MAMYRTSEVIRPKTKVGVALSRSDGSVLEGYVYAAGSERILDVVNSTDTFLPFEVSSGKVLLINKHSILMVEPHDDDWMSGGSDTKSPVLQPGASGMA